MKYDFIDIGCGHQAVSSDIFGTADNIIGLYVEPIKQYLDILPTGKNIFKENCAIYDYDGETTFNALIYDNPVYFSQDDMNELFINREKMNDYQRKYLNSGQSSFSDLTNITIDAPQKITIKTLTLESLFKKYNVTEVYNLKIDVEGYEENLLIQLYNLMANNKIKILNELKFECNYMSNEKRLYEIAGLFADDFGFTYEYVRHQWNHDIVCKKIK